MSKETRSQFIVFEGGEKVGKSTQARLLTERLRDTGLRVTQTKEPGGTEKGKEIRQKLLYEHCTPEEELALFLEDRRIHIAELIIPALADGTWVICDRFWPSTIAYQVHGRGLDEQTVRERNQAVLHDVRFDLAIFLDMDPRAAMRRLKAETRFEKEQWDFHDRVRIGFQKEAERDPQRWCIINANQEIEIISEIIWTAVRGPFS